MLTIITLQMMFMAEKQTEEKKSSLPSKSNFSEWYNSVVQDA
jgi:hypothetical protein